MNKGTIALDIDGTITGSDHLIPDSVALYFESLHQEGWQFILVTGRMFSYAMSALSKLNFPFLLAVQNGADLIMMPEKKRIKQSYLQIPTVKAVDDLHRSERDDFIIYAGFEKGDFCYYRPERQSPEMLLYLEKLKALSTEPWQETKAFETLEQQAFPLIKCIGFKEKCEAIEANLMAHEEISVSVIKDPIKKDFFLAMVTHIDANKGTAVNYFMNTFDLARPLITGGDDNNDIPLLKVGDISIAMDGAPLKLQNLAQIIAPPSHDCGIMSALKEVIGLHEGERT